MTNIDRDIELEHVNTAYFLESALAELSDEEQRIENAKPVAPQAPIQPTMSTSQFIPEALPNPDTDTPAPPFPEKWKRLSIIFAILWVATPTLFAFILPQIVLITAPLFFVLTLYCFIKGRSERKKEWKLAKEHIRNSEEFKRTCKEIQERNRAQEQKLARESEEQHQAAIEEYEMVLLPAYEKDKLIYETELVPAWKEDRNKIRATITDTQATLQEVYDHNVIPGKYRNLDALTFVSSFMGTSNYDLKFAIERYDKDIDQLIAKKHLNATLAIAQMTAQILNEQQYANYLQTQTNDLLAHGNNLLRQTKNWVAADAGMHAYDIHRTLKREKDLKKMWKER